MGQSRQSHPVPVSTNVRFTPKADIHCGKRVARFVPKIHQLKAPGTMSRGFTSSQKL
jgi:hypothetical protein